MKDDELYSVVDLRQMLEWPTNSEHGYCGDVMRKLIKTALLYSEGFQKWQSQEVKVVEKLTSDIAALTADCAARGETIKGLEDAISETLRLADFLNDAAANGAGYADHWGARVIQAVEPLRDAKAHASQTLEHNRILLEHNGILVARLTSCNEERERQHTRADEAEAQVIEERWQKDRAEFKAEHRTVIDEEGITQCNKCPLVANASVAFIQGDPRHAFTPDDWRNHAREEIEKERDGKAQI